MADAHIIAVDTYGSQRITDPHTRKAVSAYKMGYSSAVTAVLLALYGQKARDVSPKQANYRYLHIDSHVVVRHGHILLTITPDELIKAERITRQHHRAAVYLWRDQKWWEFPNTSRSDYAEPGYRSGPTSDPTGFRPPSPSTGERASVATGVIAERSQREEGGKVWWWLSGDTYPHRDLFKRYGARFSGKRKSWYWVGTELPAAIRTLITSEDQHPGTSEKVAAPNALSKVVPFSTQPVVPTPVHAAIPVMSPELAAMIEHVLAQDDAKTQSQTPEKPLLVDEQPPAIRVIKPMQMPDDGEPLDAIQTAIRVVKAESLNTMSAVPLSNGRTARIEQAYVGELTGSITGNVFCYGYSVYKGACIYLNMAGPRLAVEAIRAKLSKGDIVSVVSPDAPSIELTAGEGNSGMYHPYLHYLPEARFASLILVHDWAVTPNYGGKSTTFIFRTSDAQATTKLKHHVTQLVNIPVFEAWSAYLYEAGQRAMLVRKTRSAGGIDLLSVDLDIDAWTRLITGGLEQGVISLPM